MIWKKKKQIQFNLIFFFKKWNVINISANVVRGHNVGWLWLWHLLHYAAIITVIQSCSVVEFVCVFVGRNVARAGVVVVEYRLFCRVARDDSVFLVGLWKRSHWWVEFNFQKLFFFALIWNIICFVYNFNVFIMFNIKIHFHIFVFLWSCS